ncbi:MAG: hypothetical protein HYZ28_17865 [Myxococcales bacterium]|nr:hypothetical protein [Myxococcales bacterium]
MRVAGFGELGVDDVVAGTAEFDVRQCAERGPEVVDVQVAVRLGGDGDVAVPEDALHAVSVDAGAKQ